MSRKPNEHIKANLAKSLRLLSGTMISFGLARKLENMSLTLKWAQQWRDLGIATIPILARDKRPALDSWKRFQAELPSSRQLDLWFGSGRYNLAVVTGWRGLVVIDFDNLDKCISWIAQLEPEKIAIMNETFRVTTSRGLHYYFFSQEETACTPGDGFDIKAAGGYVLAPPSIHPFGSIYGALGTPANIKGISSVWNYVEKPKNQSWRPTPPILDAFDKAMRENGNGGLSIDDIKASHTPSSLLGLFQNGRQQMIKCPLPNHPDKRDSFAVFSDHFHCFGCGAHGDVIDLYAAIHQTDLATAISELSRL